MNMNRCESNIVFDECDESENWKILKKAQLSQHFCKAYGQPLPQEKTTQEPQWNMNLH